MTDFVIMKHPNMEKSSGRVTRDAFEKVWSKKGFEIDETQSAYGTAELTRARKSGVEIPHQPSIEGEAPAEQPAATEPAQQAPRTSGRTPARPSSGNETTE